MKIATIILCVIGFGLIIFNATLLDFNALFVGKSLIALITIASSLCAIMLLLILNTSKRIEQLSKQRK